jgi:predicted glycosyltransferase involved in capsule biosynthesis
MTQILIPFRDAQCRFRNRSLRYVTEYWESLGCEVIIGTGPLTGPFNLAAARNEAVAKSTDDILVHLDSDVIVHPDRLYEAIELAESTDQLVYPFDVIRFLQRKVTERVIRKDVDVFLLNYMRVSREYDFNKPWGGGYVIKRSLWKDVGGMDERFEGYGAEDVAFFELCSREFGEPVYIEGMAYHLWHPSTRIVTPANSDLLVQMYEEDSWK